MSDLVEDLRGRARGYRIGGPSAAHTAVMLEAAADTITALRAENERLRVQKIQMQAALGYGIMAEDERHILPSNPYKCGTCDANKHIRAEVKRLRAALEDIRTSAETQRDAILVADAALEETSDE